VSAASEIPTRPVRIASVNVNGIRAAYKRGMGSWLADRDVDILCLQEVRAPDAVVRELLGDSWHILHAEAEAKGRAGVAIASRMEPSATRSSIGEEYFETSGRWVEADFKVNGSSLTVVSAYVHSGDVGTPKQDDKYRFLDVMEARLPALAVESDHVPGRGRPQCRPHPRDIRNWKGNLKKAGLPARGTRILRSVLRRRGSATSTSTGRLAGDVDGPVHLVVLARAGLRQRHRVADRLPPRHGGPRRGRR
jgi:exodeoxyribonuclease-3